MEQAPLKIPKRVRGLIMGCQFAEFDRVGQARRYCSWYTECVIFRSGRKFWVVHRDDTGRMLQAGYEKVY